MSLRRRRRRRIYSYSMILQRDPGPPAPAVKPGRVTQARVRAAPVSPVVGQSDDGDATLEGLSGKRDRDF
jgi:hypothetical protein